MNSWLSSPRRLALSVIILSLGIMIWMGIVAVRFVNSFVRESGKVEHSWIVLASVDRLFSELQDAETGERGYMITGSRSFLAPYLEAVKKVRGQMGELSALVSDNPSQERRVREMEQLVSRRLALLENGVALGRSAPMARNTALITIMDHGKAVMDRIRQEKDAIKSSEYRTLRRRSLMFLEKRRKMLVFAGSGFATSFLMIGLSAVFLSREIDRRLRAETKARQVADEVRDLYDHAPCGYHSVDARGTILRINTTELEWLGYTREEIEGRKSIFDLIAPDSQEEYRTAFQKKFLGEAVRDQRIRLVRKNGTLFPVLLNASMIRGEDGQLVASRAVLLDLTDKQMDEEKILELNRVLSERNAQLEVSNAELEGFSYSVSHDLRAPLRSIDGFSRILQEDYSGKLDAEAERVIGVIRNNTLKMSALIDDLLAFSRMGKKAFAWTLVDMDGLVREILQGILSDRADASSVTIDIGCLPPVWGDRALLAQVWTNLLSNAFKFSEKNEKPVVRVEGMAGPAEIVYAVRDNGVGFDMRYYDKLFKVFQRLHAQADFPGTGVGLAIVQRVVSRHGGRVWGESRPGEGASFYFSLPVRERGGES
uniref:histidine kinase n=1 Tax=Leptospirillum ferriphilum TaxID=178606 RepID=A0A7C3QTU8_9BACT